MAGVRLVLTETQKGLHWTTRSNAAGYYVFTDIPSGAYEVTAEIAGFQRSIQRNIVLEVNNTVRINIRMRVGTARQTVVVASRAPLLQTDSADVHKQITAYMVNNLPMGGTRNFQQLLVLVPGATKPYRPHSDFFNPQASLDTHVNGQANPSDNLQIEGLTDNERTGLLQIYVPPADAIQEVSVTTSNYDAKYGAAGGYIANVILKSGTNQFHGSAFEFMRQNNLGSAMPYCFKAPCLTRLPGYHFNQFGGSIGGPILHNKLFFFGDWQTTMEHTNEHVVTTVPDALFRQGNFSELLNPTVYKSIGYKGPDIIYDPTTGSSSGSGRTPFAGNLIPSGRLDTIALKLAQLWPMPNLPGIVDNYQGLPLTIRDNNQFDIKLDGRISANNLASYRLSWMKPKTTEQGVFGLYGGPNNGMFNAIGTDTTYQTSANWTHIFDPTTITTVRAGVSRYRNVANPTDYLQNTASELGIRGINIEPFTSGMPVISPHGGIASLGFSASLPWIRTETDFDVVNNWTFIRGNHTLKFGWDLARLRDDLLQDQTYGPRGQFQFNSAGTGTPSDKISQGGIANGFASMLLDWPAFVGRDLPGSFPALRQTRFFGYFGDKWEMSSRLTVYLGVRDEIYQPLTPHFPGGLSNYDPTTNELVLAGIGAPMGLGVKSSFRNVAPRLGLAWRLTPGSVLRAGFGISTIPFSDNHYAFNYPIRQNNGFPSINSFQDANYQGAAVNLETGMPAPQQAVIPADGRILANTPALRSQDFVIVPLNLHEAYLESWNLAYARDLPGHFSLDLAYVGEHGVDTLYHWNSNAALQGNCGYKCEPLYLLWGKNVSTDAFLPLGDNYNGLQVKLDHRIGHGLMSTTSFSWGKAIDYGDGDDMPGLMDNVHFWRDRAVAGFNRARALSEGIVYQLPFGQWAQPGLGRKIAGGWQINGILTSYSGSPFTITAPTTLLNWPGVGQTADQVGSFNVSHGVGYGATWFDPNAFTSVSQKGVMGNVGRNSHTGPAAFNLDFSLFRNFQLSERMHAIFRAEAFNLTNTPNFSNPHTGVTDPYFGHITGTSNGPRSFQFGLQLEF